MANTMARVRGNRGALRLYGQLMRSTVAPSGTVPKGSSRTLPGSGNGGEPKCAALRAAPKPGGIGASDHESERAQRGASSSMSSAATTAYECETPRHPSMCTRSEPPLGSWVRAAASPPLVHAEARPPPAAVPPLTCSSEAELAYRRKSSLCL